MAQEPTPQPTLPWQWRIIQGGMGVYISSPFLARIVSILGGLGTISGVAPERIMALILQKGDPGGHFRRALKHFPFPDIANTVLTAFFIEEGDQRTPRAIPKFNIKPEPLLIALSITANFAFVWLAKEGHTFPVSINYLEKIAMPHIYSIYGAMLAGIDVITMGAGIPRHIPDVIDAYLQGCSAKYPIPVEGTNNGSNSSYEMCFHPKAFFGESPPPMKRPLFIPIVGGYTLAAFLKKSCPDKIDGFVIEEPTAGGHNAPPRGKLTLNASGEPIYGPKDKVDYKEIADLGLPFWKGGAQASRESLEKALSEGAQGVQLGTVFALCQESGMHPDLKDEVLRRALDGTLKVLTTLCSPTGFPFKVAQIPGTLSEREIYESLEPVCIHGALRTLFFESDGSIGYRCPSEPVKPYLSKGGKFSDTAEKRCICSGLLATAGLEDRPPIVTLGDDVMAARRIITGLRQITGNSDCLSYSAADVFRYVGVPIRT